MFSLMVVVLLMKRELVVTVMPLPVPWGSSVMLPWPVALPKVQPMLLFSAMGLARVRG